MRSNLARWLSGRRAPGLILGIALLLASPSLNAGLMGDDHFHKLVLSGQSKTAGLDHIPDEPFDMFRFADGNVERARAMMDAGMLGWWADPTMRMNFLRPGSVLTHMLDYALWPDSPMLMHAQSLCWYALALLGLWILYRRTLLHTPGEGARATTALAFLFFAWDDAHGMALSWLANRNAIVALALSLPVLILHDRSRRDAHRPSAWLAPACLALALCAGEAALAVGAYLFSYALFIDGKDRQNRRGALASLWPYALVAAGWAVVYRGFGHGVSGSGLTIDPGSEPLRFALAVAERLPILLTGQLAFPPADLWEPYVLIARWLPAAVLLYACLLLCLVALALRPLLMNNAEARFYAVGALLSAVPVCAQFPHDRLLLFIGVGASPVIALYVAGVSRGASWLSPASPFRRAHMALAAALFFFHGVLAPLWLPLRTRSPADAAYMIEVADDSLDSSPAIRDKTVVLLNPPGDAYGALITMRRAAMGKPRPAYLRWLATGSSAITLSREDARSLRVRPADGFLSLPSEIMQRIPEGAFEVGDHVRLTDLDIEITALTDDERPAEIIARFGSDLEDEKRIFLQWTPGGFAPFELPAVGASVVLPPVDFMALVPPLIRKQ